VDSAPAVRGRNFSRVAAGVAIWAAVLLGIGAAAAARGTELRTPVERIGRFAWKPSRHVEVRIEATWDAKAEQWVLPLPGDPLLAERDRTYLGCIESVNEVAAVGTRVAVARIALDPEFDADSFEGASYRFSTAAGDMGWVIETLLPKEKRERVLHEVSTFAGEHREEIAGILRPLGEDVLEHAMHVLDQNLAPALARHEKEVQALLDKHRATLKDDLLPVLKTQLGPSVREKAKPILTKIGRECWDALPMWDLGWSALRDKLPWQNKSYIDDWWKNFLDTKAIPIVKEHEDELMKAGEDLVSEGLKDPKVRAAFSEASKRLAKDPDFKRLVRVVIEESLVLPFDPAGLLKKLLEDPGHRARLAELERSFSPTLQRIARMLSIDEKTNGLSPDLARVLRRIVFGKDVRWIAVTPLREIRPLSAPVATVAEPARPADSPGRKF
jgi:hypothetical protein